MGRLTLLTRCIFALSAGSTLSSEKTSPLPNDASSEVMDAVFPVRPCLPSSTATSLSRARVGGLSSSDMIGTRTGLANLGFWYLCAKIPRNIVTI